MERETPQQQYCKECTAPLPFGSISAYCARCIAKAMRPTKKETKGCIGCGMKNGLHRPKCYYDPNYKPD